MQYIKRAYSLKVSKFMIAFMVVTLCLAGSALPVLADDKLTNLSIEDLMELEISAVTKSPRKVSDSAAAVFVITPEDIRRSGAANLPDVLRMVPGLQVAQVGADKWAITARGSNGLFANKLLVMIDGRTVYTPIFSGVFWNQQDTVLEDIARIEVIRGPGATVWGANAVNGVINIITRQSADTQGGLITSGMGTETRGLGSLRYGGKEGSTTYRVYGRGRDIDNSAPLSGQSEVQDQWQSAEAGFRTDSELSSDSQLMLQGDVSKGKTHFDGTVPAIREPFFQNIDQPSGFHGFNLLGRLNQQLSSDSALTIQGYFDRVRRDETILRDGVDTFDLDVQHNIKYSETNDIIWGIGYRRMVDQLEQTGPTIEFSPDERALEIFSGFIQDELSLLNDTVILTAGSKFQHNDFTGFEIQPSARALWKVSENHSLWTAFSRAVRTPSRAERDGSVQVSAQLEPLSGLPAVYTVQGSRSLDSEETLAYEIGYRAVINPDFKFDLSTFYNQEHSLAGLETGLPILSQQSGAPYLLVPGEFKNSGALDTFGLELITDIQICDSWRGQIGYTFQGYDFHSYGIDSGANNRGIERENPSHTASIRSLLNLTDQVDLDGMIRYVDNIAQYNIDPYIELDLRLGWRLSSDFEVSILGQNLLNAAHEEYQSNFINFTPAQAQRGVFGKVTWKFD